VSELADQDQVDVYVAGSEGFQQAVARAMAEAGLKAPLTRLNDAL
jgi:NAD(P)H-flavin reductase